MGLTVKPWNGRGTAPATLVIGRDSFSTNLPRLPFDLEALVHNGARVMICAQAPAWFQHMGFRVAEHLPRRIYPVSAEHPVVQGLDAADLCNWTGVSTLAEAFPEVPVQSPAWRSPEFGWHWGNRGVVSSAMLEKPHLSGWRPILEGEFDLAYSPLMELDYGKGRLTLCTLDLEDHYTVDPAADLLGRQLVKYIASAPLAPRADSSVVYVGADAGAALLDQLGVLYTRATSIAPGSKLLVVGPEGQVTPDQVRALCQAGGHALFLARQNAAGPLGVTLERVRRLIPNHGIHFFVELEVVRVNGVELFDGEIGEFLRRRIRRPSRTRGRRSGCDRSVSGRQNSLPGWPLCNRDAQRDTCRPCPGRGR